MDFESNAVDLESLDGSHKLGRRSFLMGALATGAAASMPLNYAAKARAGAIPLAKEGDFALGVASGFPRPRGILLWTQLDGIKKSSKLRLTVATDRGFNNVVKEKTVTARADRGFTARSFINGLKPREEYFYRFHTENSNSQVGRFRTAPPLNSNEPIKIAFYSCQNYEAGFFNAQAAIAREKDVDLVVCLGDYMYEYSDFEGVRLDKSGNNHDGDVQLLEEYRQKYELYKRDKNLQAMHAAYPFISVWDDHEVEDNHAGDHPSSAQSDPNKTNLKNLPRRVSYLQRKQNGHRAFFNYMPRQRFKGDRDRIYEDYRLGKNVDLILTDERNYRDQQPCNDAILTPCPSAGDPRTFLGEKQKQWFLRSMKASPANWKVWGTELMVMSLRIAPGSPAQVDAWDGYSNEREQILNYLVDNGVKDIVAITGDIHTFFTGTAYTKGDKNTAGSRAAFPEFVGGSATSAGIPEATGLSDSTLTILAAGNPHIDYYDFHKKGYGILSVNKNEVIAELKSVDHLSRRPGPATVISRHRVVHGDPVPQKLL